MPDFEHTDKNHLSSASSPYLQQHAENPVHWHSWGEEAFALAQETDRPVFLSIGYATCHWCHVMAHESFEDEDVAQLMNDAFINIKVDREERPDIDHTYMRICQMITGRGGWPLTIVTTPDKKPFFASTYLPKHGRQGQPGMMELIPRLNNFWRNKRDKIYGSARKITKAFQKTLTAQQKQAFSDDILEKTIHELKTQFDDTHGGFGSAPKFPSPHTLVFLLRYDAAFENEEAASMAKQTLIKMRRGGIFDHLGGGFHRYSTDRCWLVPHFEKMLYDQAMHLVAYMEGWKSCGHPLFKETVEKITSYLFRDLQHPEGAFYSAEDADSEGEEGTFYVWHEQEIREVLSKVEAELAIEVFNIQADGNYDDESTGRQTGKNILHRTKSMAELAGERNMQTSQLREKLGEIRRKLMNKRSNRERPFLDDKILSSWNGLIIAALSQAGSALEESNYIAQAERAASFIFEHLQTKDGQLLHRFRNGHSAINSNANDYASLIWGLLELYQATFKSHYLQKAVRLQTSFIEQFWDDKHGGFFFTSQKSEELLGREKKYFDGAQPAANSIAAMNLLRLGRITARPEWEKKAEQLANSTAKHAEQRPTSFAQLLQAHLWSHQPTFEVVIAGRKDTESTKKFIREIRNNYIPNGVMILNDPADDAITNLAPYLRNQTIIDGKPTIYICQNHACKEPVHTLEELKKQIQDGILR